MDFTPDLGNFEAHIHVEYIKELHNFEVLTNG